MENYVEEIKQVISNLDLNKIRNLADKIRDVKERDGTVFILGNGGSAVTASHWACDLGKGTLKRFYNDEKRLRVISLTDNVATITAFANDLSYDEIFSQQLKNLIKKDDLVIIMTGSGKSRNIINAINIAKTTGAYVFSLLGFDGGEVIHLSNQSIIIPSKNYGIIEDLHLMIGHLLTIHLKGEINSVN